MGASAVEDEAGRGEGVVLNLASAAEAARPMGLIAALKRCAAQKPRQRPALLVRSALLERAGPSATQRVRFEKPLLRSG